MEHRQCLNNVLVPGLILLMLVGFTGSGISGIPEPITQVENSVNEVLRLLNDPELSAESATDRRRQRIMAIVDQRFDFGEMSRRTLGNYWKGIGEGDRKAFVDKYALLLKNNYVGKLESYSGEKVVFERQIVKKSRAAVFTHFLRNKEKIVIIYKLVQKNETWLVYDMVIEGVSVVKNYRSQFDSVIKNEKFSGLLKRIDDKNRSRKP